MAWQPGTPVRTAQDEAEWKVWRAERKRQQQRDRRAQYPRIDYYPSKEAARVIDAAWQAGRPGFSSVLDRIVVEWAEQCHRNKESGNEGGGEGGEGSARP